MPAKKVIKKEDVIKASLSLIRKNGEEGLNARGVAAELGCSTQPVYAAFSCMGELEEECRQQAACVLDDYMQKEIECGKYPPNKAIGMGYLRFAAEEKNLYRFLFIKKGRSNSVINAEMTAKSVKGIAEANGISEKTAERFFSELWIFMHGYASLIASDIPSPDEEETSEYVTDVYAGLALRHGLIKK